MNLDLSKQAIVEKLTKSGIVAAVTSSHDQAAQKASLLEAAAENLYPNYAQPALIMSHGQGSVLFDTDGRRYIDFFAGIAVSTLGHAHPALVEAVSKQASQLLHLSNYYYTEPNVRLSQKLCALSGMDRAFFCNSGTEANEAALKLARRYFFDGGQPQRNVVLAFSNSFHGRTLGSMTATGQAKYRDGFGPLSGVVHAPFGDLQAARSLMNDTIAAILVEPIQGEGGVVMPEPGFLSGLREICDESGALLILDEIQTGVGRTGTFLACEHEGVRADVVTLAKALGGGVPIGAMLCQEKYKSALPLGSHGTTFGGNPLASAAALAVLNVIEEQQLLTRVTELGKSLEQRLDALAERLECLVARRGQGLLQALILRDPSRGADMLVALREAGLLVTFAGGSVIRVSPPLTITDTELDEGLQILERVLEEFS